MRRLWWGVAFHLISTSPAIGAADPTATLGIDHDGVMRPQGA